MKIFPCLLSGAYAKNWRYKNMKHLKLITVLLALLLAAMAMVPMVSAAGQPDPGKEKIVDTDKAASIALLNVRDVAALSSEYDSWKNAEVALSTTYYNLNDELSAYAFDVIVDGQNEGYIIISATEDNYPALELSRGTLPGKKASAMKKDQARAVDSFAAKKGLTAESSKPVYLGGTFFYEKYELVDTANTKQASIIVDVTDNRVIDLSDKAEVIPFNTSPSRTDRMAMNADIKKQWDRQNAAIEQFNTESFTTASAATSSGTQFINNVPNYAWYIGCSPTASGMVLGYWKNMGYTSLPSGTTLINELANAMGTSRTWPLNGATWPWNIASGISTLASNHGYSNFYSFSRPDDAWDTLKSEINANRPFVISMLHGGVAADSNTNQAYGEHSVACIGYMEGSTTQNRWVTIYDTWDTGRSHLLQYQNWWNAQETYVRP